MRLDRIRVANHKGYKIEIWLRYDRRKREIYSYKILTPEGEEIRGREYLPPEEWSREQILDGLLKALELKEIGK